MIEEGGLARFLGVVVELDGGLEARKAEVMDVDAGVVAGVELEVFIIDGESSKEWMVASGRSFRP